MVLIQLLLPVVEDTDPNAPFEQTRRELAMHFTGLTAYAKQRRRLEQITDQQRRELERLGRPAESQERQRRTNEQLDAERRRNAQ